MFCCFSKKAIDPPSLAKSKPPYIDRIDYTQFEYKNCKNFIPQLQHGKVVSIYDGDTITVCSTFYEGQPVSRFKIRLRGLDAPEIKGRTPEEKQAALISRDCLREKILGHTVDIRNCEKEKWGRVLADVYLGNIHINQWLLDEKLAVPYDGGTKPVFRLSQHRFAKNSSLIPNRSASTPKVQHVFYLYNKYKNNHQ